jgi:hypothetical protein
MKNINRFATPLIAVAMMTVPMMALAQSSQTGNATNNTTASADVSQTQAYRDGIEAVKLDTAAARPIDPTKSHLYVAPPVKKDAREGYRTAFVAGYQAAASQGTNVASGR